MSLPGKHTYRCKAPNCDNIYYSNITDINYLNKHFFRVPHNEAKRQMWLESVESSCNIRLKLTSENYYFCEDHFESDCFRNELKERLNRDAVPTLFKASSDVNSKSNYLLKCNKSDAELSTSNQKFYVGSSCNGKNCKSDVCESVDSDGKLCDDSKCFVQGIKYPVNCNEVEHILLIVDATNADVEELKSEKVFNVLNLKRKHQKNSFKNSGKRLKLDNY